MHPEEHLYVHSMLNAESDTVQNVLYPAELPCSNCPQLLTVTLC